MATLNLQSGSNTWTSYADTATLTLQGATGTDGTRAIIAGGGDGRGCAIPFNARAGTAGADSIVQVNSQTYTASGGAGGEIGRCFQGGNLPDGSGRDNSRTGGLPGEIQTFSISGLRFGDTITWNGEGSASLEFNDVTPVYTGNTEITDLYIGSTRIVGAYRGTDQIL